MQKPAKCGRTDMRLRLDVLGTFQKEGRELGALADSGEESGD